MSYKVFNIRHNNCSYTVEADITYTPQISSNKHLAVSDWDMQAELSIEDVFILDSNNVDVTECNFIPEQELKRLIQREIESEIDDYIVDMEWMSSRHMSELVDVGKEGNYL